MHKKARQQENILNLLEDGERKRTDLIKEQFDQSQSDT